MKAISDALKARATDVLSKLNNAYHALVNDSDLKPVAFHVQAEQVAVCLMHISQWRELSNSDQSLQDIARIAQWIAGFENGIALLAPRHPEDAHGIAEIAEPVAGLLVKLDDYSAWLNEAGRIITACVEEEA